MSDPQMTEFEEKIIGGMAPTMDGQPIMIVLLPEDTDTPEKIETAKRVARSVLRGTGFKGADDVQIEVVNNLGNQTPKQATG